MCVWYERNADFIYVLSFILCGNKKSIEVFKLNYDKTKLSSTKKKRSKSLI